MGSDNSAVIVPFDPAVAWFSATSTRRMGYGKHVGSAVQRTIDGEAFEAWVWFCFKQWRNVVADEGFEAAGGHKTTTVATAYGKGREPTRGRGGDRS